MVVLIWVFHMNLLNFLRRLFIFASPATHLAGHPLVVNRLSHMKQLSDKFYEVPFLFNEFPAGGVVISLSLIGGVYHFGLLVLFIWSL